MGRLFKNYDNKITQAYKPGTHNGIDLVGKGNNNVSCLDYITAHSDGTVVETVKNYTTTDKTGSSYGNYVKIQHSNGYYTLYAHMKHGSVTVSVGDKVTQGQAIGYMGNTGHSFGAHLHFEVRNESNTKIDPTPYIDANLPGISGTINSTPASSDKESVRTYTVQKGDTLWGIAKKYLGNGSRYSEIKRLNGLTSDTINVGQVLKLYSNADIQSSGSNTASGSTAAMKNIPSYVKNGLNYALVFDPAYYMNKYNDLKQAFGNDAAKLFNHFLTYGMKESRQAISTFNVTVYKNTYEDLRKAFGNDMPLYYKHYIQYGHKENRKTT